MNYTIEPRLLDYIIFITKVFLGLVIIFIKKKRVINNIRAL